MNVLAIDTSTDHLSLAVARDGKIASRYHRRCAMAHSRVLIGMIDRVLREAKVKVKEIDTFAISIGPGSFTGLRIGVTTVKGLSYALGKKIVAVPTLDIIARNAKFHKGTICPIMDARKGKVYACIYSSDGKKVKRLSKYLLMPATELLKRLKQYEDVLFLGDALEQAGAKAVVASWHPRASIAAGLATDEARRKNYVKAEDLEPLYLYSRECDIVGK